MGLIARLKTWASGEILTHTDLNAEFDNLIDSLDPDAIIGASATQGAMDATTDPYPGASPSLATNLRGELQRLRYRLQQEHASSKHYIFPDIKNIVASDSPFAATRDHRIIKCDVTNGAITVTLPPVSGLVDKLMYIKQTASSANVVTIAGNGAETIDGAATKTLNLGYNAMVLACDGVQWHILADINKGVVTLTDTQTLSNKTLNSPTIPSMTNAQHDHSNAAGGGSLATDSVTTNNIVSSGVTNAKLATDAVTTAKIAASAVTATKIAAGAVDATKLYPASFTAGTKSFAFSGNEVTRTTSASSYVASGKAIQIKKAGTYRINFDARTANNYGGEFARLYKNSTTAIGIERTLTTIYTTYSEDLTLSAGDVVQVYWKTIYGYALWAKNFGLYVNEENATILYVVQG